MATGLFTDTAAADTIFLSTQLRPIEEATKVRNEILAGVKTPVEYVVEEPPQFAVRMEAERQTGKGTISLVGALHGELAPLVPKGTLRTLDDLSARLSDRGIPDDLMELGKLGTEHQHYIPWMQATYIMVANKEALPFLPEGANVDTLTYAQLTEWGRRIAAGTGRRKIGFPAGPTGLIPIRRNYDAKPRVLEHPFWEGWQPDGGGSRLAREVSAGRETGRWAPLTRC